MYEDHNCKRLEKHKVDEKEKNKEKLMAEATTSVKTAGM